VFDDSGSLLGFSLRCGLEAHEVRLKVSGRADNPEILFTSQPELPQEEVLARLIFGRGLETLSPLQAARLAVAVRTLAGQGGEGVVGNIRNSAGLADLDVTTDEEGNAAVRAGAYLGENVYTDVEVDSAGETNLNLNLDVSPSVTLKGSVNNEGDTSLGVFFERDY
jgi:translocation and assembly module TamB